MDIAKAPEVSASGSWRQVRGPIVTLAVATLCELLAHTFLRVANPPAFFVLAVVFAAFDGGIRAGLISAAVAWAYIAYFFAEPVGFFRYSDADLRRIVVWAFVLPVMAYMVGILNRRAARLAAEVRDISELRHGEEAIRLSEERYRNLIEGSIQGIAIHDENGKALFANQAFASIFGFGGPEEILRLNSLDELIPADELSRIKSYRRARLRGEPAPAIYEARRLKHDGTAIWLDNRSRLIRWNGVPAIQAIVVDITERKHAEEALKASEAALSQAQRLAHLVRYHWSITEQRLKSWDPGYGEILCVNAVPGRQGIFTETPFHPEDRDRVRHLYESAERGRMNVDLEFRIIRPDGEPRWIRELSEMVLDSEERPSGYVGTLQDVTEQKRAEENLRQSEQRYRSLADNLPGIVYRRVMQQNGETHETYVSAGVKKILGVDPEEFTSGRAKLIDYLHPEEKERKLTLLRQSSERIAPLLIESERFIGRGGEVRWWQVYATPRRLPDGNTQFDGIALDITEQRAAALQLRKSQRLEAVGQLTSGISHDFNNLLGVIIGNLDLALERAGDNHHLQELIQAANGSALRGAELTKRLLAFSRGQPLAPEAIDLSQILPQIVEMLRRTLGEQVVVQLRQRQEDLWPCLVDRSQIEDVILNLAINARDAMPNGGTFTIETSNADLDQFYASAEVDVTPGDYVLLAVSDTGSGMTADVLEHVFEPFFTTKEERGGTGLGLSMVYGFVKQSKGHIKLYSEIGHGTTVKIYLPRALSDLTHAPTLPQQADMPRGSEIILVVDDNPRMRAVTVSQLTNLGYTALEAESAADALDMLEQRANIDLLLSDVIMPGGMNGYELASVAQRRRPSLKTLLMSGYASRSLLDLPNEIERPELINKPFRMHDLALKLRQALGKA